MSKPQEFEDDFTIKILRGTSPKTLAKIIHESMASPYNLGSTQVELQKAVVPYTESLIASASLWKTAHDLAPNVTLSDRFQWWRGNVSRDWDTGELFVGDEGKFQLQFEDFKKSLIHINSFDYSVSLDVNAPPFWSLNLRYAPNNVLGSVGLRILDGFPLYTPDEEEKGNPKYNKFVEKYLTPSGFTKKQRKEGIFVQHNLSWDLTELDLRLDLIVRIDENKWYQSTSAFEYDSKLDEYIRHWGDRQSDGISDFGNAQAFNLSTEGRMNKDDYTDILTGVLDFIPTEIHG